MDIKKARQILKSFSDDTRLRIINLLNKRELSVTHICCILNKNQSNLSKHLTRLRLTGIVGDQRKGFNVYYHLLTPREKVHRELLKIITIGLAELDRFKQDIKELRLLERKNKRTNLFPSGERAEM